MSKRKKTSVPGLYLNEHGYYEADKRVSGVAIRRSTETRKFDEAVKILEGWVHEIRQAQLFGQRPARVYEDMASEYLERNMDISTIKSVAGFIRRMLPYFSGEAIHELHEDHYAVQRLKKDLKAKGRKNKTINAYVEILSRMLNQAEQWRDQYGMTWIDRAPRFKMLPLDDARPPHPLNWDQQLSLLNELPEHLEPAALFTINTGVRDWALCRLQWEWERETDFGIVFEVDIVHARQKEKGLVICNSVATEVIESQRGMHPTHVFCYRDRPLTRMSNSGWKSARTRAGLEGLHFHDLRHTYGYRLREAGVDEETRADLLRHKGKSITTHYSSADIKKLFEAAEKIVGSTASKPVLRLVSR